jgi:hypothetical protein
MTAFTVNSGEAIEWLLSIRSTDVPEIRLMIDALLEVWTGKLILFPSSWVLNVGT